MFEKLTKRSEIPISLIHYFIIDITMQGNGYLGDGILKFKCVSSDCSVSVYWKILTLYFLFLSKV